MAFFLCTLIHGPSWDDAREIREQDGWGAHAAFMDRLVEDGLIVVGGPVGTGDHTAHLIQGEDPRQIRARLAEDPWAKDNHLAVGSLEPWALWLDGRNSATKRDDPDCARSSVAHRIAPEAMS